MKKFLPILTIGILILTAKSFAADGVNVFNFFASDGGNDPLFADSTYNEYIRDIKVGSDLDQDGRKEIIVTDFRTVDESHHGRIIVYEFTENDTLRPAWEYDLPFTGYYSNIRSIATGDLDGNGKGEIIAAVTGSSGDTLSSHVGVWVFEWDGVSGSDNYNLVAQITDFATYQDSTGAIIYPDRYRCEDIAVGDFDNDGKDEVLWVNNASTAFDNAYIFSINGEFSTGFYSTVVETVFKRTELGYHGSTVSGYGPVDMDNDGNPEGIITIWNNIGVQVFEADAPNHYVLKYHAEGLDPQDRYPFAKAIGVYDLNGDGVKELIVGSLLRGRVHILEPYNGDVDSMIHYMPYWTVLDSSQDASGNWTYDTTDMFRIYGMKVGDPDHGPGHDNGDIILSDLNQHIYDIEYNGGDFGDTASYTVYNVFDIFPSDTFIYSYQDTSGSAMSDTVVCNSFPGPGIAIGNDLNGDGENEIIFSTYTSHFPPDTFSITTGFLNILEHGERTLTGNIVNLLSTNAKPGDTVSVFVSVSFINYIAGMQGEIVYDSSKLEFQNMALDSAFDQFTLTQNPIGGNKVRFIIVSMSGDSIGPGNDTVFVVRFLVKNNVQIGDSTFINLSNVTMSDPSANSVTAYGIGGWVYFRGLKGDLNLDDSINISDVVREINIILGKPPAPSQYELWAGDVNDDGVIDVVDVVGTVNIILGRSKLGMKSSIEFVRIWENANNVYVESNVKIGGMQLDIIGDVEGVYLNNELSDMKLYSSDIDGGKRILIIGFKGIGINQGINKILHYSGNGKITKVVISDINGHKVNVERSLIDKLLFIGPNPIIRGNLKVSFILRDRSRVRINIIDITGRLVKRIAFQGRTGINEISINLDTLRSGVYFVMFKTPNLKMIRKIVKQ